MKVNCISWLAENIAEHNMSLIWRNLLFITIVSYMFGILSVKLFNIHVLQCANFLQVSQFNFIFFWVDMVRDSNLKANRNFRGGNLNVSPYFLVGV